MTNLLKKTAIATAMAAAMSAPAMAADFSFAGGFAATGTVVLASEIFGDEEGSGANETLVVMGNTQFDLSAAAGAGALLTEDGDNMNQGTNATIKYTLGSGAVFAEDLSTTAAVNAANGGAGAFSCTAGAVGAVVADSAVDTTCGLTAAADATWEVIQGGAIGDNTITFRITAAAADGEQSIGGITFGNVAIKNLIPSLGDGGVSTFRGSLLMGVEYVEAAETTADTIVTTATDAPLQIFGSQPGVSLTSTAINFDTAAQDFIRINVGTGETTFTDNDATQGNTSNDGRTDFTAAGDLTTVLLGTMTFARSTIDTATFTSSAAGIVKKESGGDFDFQGGDTHNISFSVGSGSLQVGGDLFLEDVADGCDASGITDMTGESVTITNGSSVSMPVTGTTTELSSTHNLCYTVDGTSKIPEVANSISASWVVDFFNTRYDNTDASTSSWGGLVRNGCIASFFNIPRSDNAVDRAFVRLTNTSTTNSGDIRGTMYAQDGSIIGTEDATVAPTLAIHATQIFTSQADDFTSGGYTVLSLNKALGATDAEYDDYGRGRLVLKGAFDTCEGMGLIRNLETGALYNMTSTTMGNEAGGANDGDRKSVV